MLKQRGDTLIEVLFAFGVFSLVAVGSLTIMNQGVALSQRSIETSLVRQTVNDQAETLRFFHDSYVASYVPGQVFNPADPNKGPAWQWQAMEQSIKSTNAQTATVLGGANPTCPTAGGLPGGGFILDTQKAQFIPPASVVYQPADTYAQVQYNNGPKPYGIWIEAIRSKDSSDPSQTNLGYIDFHIQACWSSAASSVPATLSTIVRLYEPR